MIPKIPDNVWNNRCKYCSYRIPGINNIGHASYNVFSSGVAKDYMPCKILGLSENTWVNGECENFEPCKMFGLCQSCHYENNFIEPERCTYVDGPVNRREVYTIHHVIGGKCADHYVHRLSTCDRYKVKGYWKNLIFQNVLQGRAPTNFDPNTWEPVDPFDSKTVACWEEKKLLLERKEENLKHIAVKKTICLLSKYGIKYRERDFTDNIFVVKSSYDSISCIRCVLLLDNSERSKKVRKLKLETSLGLNVTKYNIVFEYLTNELEAFSID